MNIIYVMHVDWNWIKQRPQYIAEFLGKNNTVSIVYDKNYKSHRLSSNDPPENCSLRAFYRIPGEFKNRFIRLLNSFHRKALLRNLIRSSNTDVLWLSFPTMVDSIPDNYRGIVVYDCMDDHFAMASARAKSVILECENRLLKRADLVLFSSKRLETIVTERIAVSKPYIIRNGYIGSDFIDAEGPEIRKEDGAFHLCYFGTVSSWFDWDTVLHAIHSLEGLYVHILGPVNFLPDTVNHERLIFHGPVKHNELKSYVQDMDCFIMPFIINDIILSVDPVKLYEYIAFNKNIIVSYYPEIDRFKEFVYFYESKEDFLNRIRTLMDNNNLKYDIDASNRFLAESTWDARCKDIERILVSCRGNK